MTDLILCELDDATRFGVASFSPFCLKVHAALVVSGLPFQRRHGQRPGSWKQFNPTAQVPVLLEGDRPTPDSTAILRRIVELAPGRIAESPEGWLWEELADTSLNGFLIASRWADPDNWPRVRQAYFAGMPSPVRAIVPALLRRNILRTLVARDVWRAGPTACWDRFDRLLDQLDARAPTEGFWCGDRLGVADLGLYGQLRSFGTELTPVQGAAVASRPRLSAWLGRVEQGAVGARALAA